MHLKTNNKFHLIKAFLLFITIIIIFYANANAQNQITMDSIDSKMEKMFDDNNWYEMIPYGESMLRLGFDYFYLRARLGIAYYMTKDYFNAIPNFERALEVGYDNPTVLEYLYYSYLYTGREADKNYMFKQLPGRLRKKIKPLENPMADNLHVESGIGISNDPDKNSNVNFDGDNGSLRQQIINGNEFYFNTGLNQLPVDFLNVSYDYTYLKTQKTAQMQYQNEIINNDYYQYQNRFYNSFDFRIAQGLTITPAGHYLTTEEDVFTVNSDSAVYVLPDSVKYFYSFPVQENSYNSFVLSLDISKYISIYKFGINGSYSYLNKMHQSQYGLSFKVFPFSKINFYSYTNLVLQNQNSITNLIADQSFTGMFNNIFFYEAFATVGKMSNYNEHNGYRVYNNSDAITYKLGFELKYFLTKNFSADFIYSFQNRERNYLTYTTPVSQEPGELNYQVNNFALKINYSF